MSTSTRESATSIVSRWSSPKARNGALIVNTLARFVDAGALLGDICLELPSNEFRLVARELLLKRVQVRLFARCVLAERFDLVIEVDQQARHCLVLDP
jgi:hypothetical protein